MFAGNIGEAQDFENIMAAANILKEYKNIHFIILGDGRKKMWIDKYIAENHLYDTVHCFGRFPLESMPSFFEQANALLVTLKDELIFNLTVPAKVQAYMSGRKPIIAMLNGEAATLINNVGCGVAINASNHVGLTQIIRTFACKDILELEKMGRLGKQYSDKYFDFHNCMDNIESIMAS